jgi:DnaK suppressor protein
MFVSLLQLMGFPVAEPVNSRAKEDAQRQSSTAGIAGITSKASEVDTQVHSARRQEVKAQSGKPKMASKAIDKDKPNVKAVAKPVADLSAKPRVKKPSPVKASEIAAPIQVVKPTAKDKVKVQVKDSVKTTTAKASKPEVLVSKPKVTHTVKPGTIATAAASAKPVVVAPAQVDAPSVPARAGRPSSRLAQLTVPSMAQSVASTAAKASFTQTTPVPFIIPPLASSVKKDPKLANNWKLKPVEQLTDADVIAMPDDEYMNDTQLAFFRLKLSVIKQEILSNAGETTEHLREETVVVPDPTDRATIEEEHALELRTRDRERKLLKKIEQSIQRIDAGEYGYCDETGEPIGVGRLLARPTANLSLEAQQRRELRQKMFGD